jgi:tetratricopeptide (TPR) repeat protein
LPAEAEGSVMDGHRADLHLKELKRIKWLLVLVAFGLLSLPFSLMYFGWEVASTVLQEKAAEDKEDGFETVAEDLFRKGMLDELMRLADRREKDHPNDANVHWYRGRIAVERGNWDLALRELEKAEQLAPHWKQEYTGPLLEKVRAQLAKS